MEKSLQSRDTIRTKKIFSFLSAGGKSEEKLLRNPFCVKEFKNVRECSMLPEEEVRQSTKRVGWSETLLPSPFQLQFHATGKFAPKYFDIHICKLFDAIFIFLTRVPREIAFLVFFCMSKMAKMAKRFS